MLVTCAYLVDASTPWVMQSLFLSVIGEARDRGVKAIETFGYRYPEGESAYERFFVHRTIFPSDFLADFGFTPIRWSGQVALARLELGGLQPVEEGAPASHARRGWEALTDAVIEAVAEEPAPKVFMLWGSQAQAKRHLILRHDGRHLLLESNHPSPLSARR